MSTDNLPRGLLDCLGLSVIPSFFMRTNPGKTQPHLSPLKYQAYLGYAYFDIHVRLEAGELDQISGQSIDLHGTAHVKHKDLDDHLAQAFTRAHDVGGVASYLFFIA